MNAFASPSRPRAVFRCDASPGLGGGHVMRCLTLAEALAERGWSCSFATRPETLAVAPRLPLRSEGLLLLDVPAPGEPSAIGEWLGGRVDLLVVDHYQRELAFELACRPWAHRILVIDDLPVRPHEADLLLDQTYGRGEAEYAPLLPAHCRVLAGPAHCLLRPPFAEARPASVRRRAGIGRVEHVLVAFGATDPGNASALALRAIAASGLSCEVAVLLGAGAPHLARVRAEAAAMPRPARIHADTDDVAPLMAWADLAIGAGGGMAWERCCLGLPALLLETAGNQAQVVRALASAGAATFVGAAAAVSAADLAAALRDLACDPQRLAAMADAAAAVCDGEGVARVLMALSASGAPAEDRVSLRPATLDDGPAMLAWQMHPTTRRYAFDPRPPSPETHRRWLRERLADPDCLLRIVLSRGAAVGSLRLDRRQWPGIGEVRVVSIVVAPECRGLGFGGAALSLARRLLPDVPLLAQVKAQNVASRRLFAAAGYLPFAAGVYVNWRGEPADAAKASARLPTGSAG